MCSCAPKVVFQVAMDMVTIPRRWLLNPAVTRGANVDSVPLSFLGSFPNASLTVCHRVKTCF